MPNSLLEAQALGIPAVSTRCRYGPDEIIEDGQSGLLVPTDEPEAMAQALLRILDDKLMRVRMGARAAENVKQKFAVQEITQKWEEIVVDVS